MEGTVKLNFCIPAPSARDSMQKAVKRTQGKLRFGWSARLRRCGRSITKCRSGRRSVEGVFQRAAGGGQAVHISSNNCRSMHQRAGRDHQVRTRMADASRKPTPDPRILRAEGQDPVSDKARRPVEPQAQILCGGGVLAYRAPGRGAARPR